jgi:hypothetical protein
MGAANGKKFTKIYMKIKNFRYDICFTRLRKPVGWVGALGNPTFLLYLLGYPKRTLRFHAVCRFSIRSSTQPTIFLTYAVLNTTPQEFDVKRCKLID